MAHGMFALAGRVALITGASAGIGEAVARLFVGCGARVVINARREDRLRSLADQLNLGQPKPMAEMVVGDAADQNIIDQMINAGKSAFGSFPDCVVVNAGRGLNGSVLTSDIAAWEDMVRVNVVGAARLIRSASERMIDRSAGKIGPPSLEVGPRDIIAIGSVVGRHVSPFSSMYGATKFALHGMIEGVRREVAGRGIRASLVEPGFVVSEFQDVAGYNPSWVKDMFERIGPPLTPDDVARSIAFIASQPAGVHVSDILIRPTRQDYP
jgi:NADP-dependent 3-hydroxy acid dehydrogenase YdfG